MAKIDKELEKPPEDNKDLELDPLENAEDADEELAMVNELERNYKISLAEDENLAKSRPIYKHGVLDTVCVPTDPSMALIQSSGSYMFHLAFFLTIYLLVEETSPQVYCFKLAENFVSASDKDSWVPADSHEP